MAKIKNRDKRKKAAVKKANQVKAGKPEMYEGYMRIPLNNSFTPNEVRIRTEYEGDWINPKVRNNPVGTIDFLEDENGKPLSDAEARIELNKLLAMGHTVMPVGTDCEGFDVFGGGCPGHEPLAGSDLSLELLRSHRDFIVAYVADTSDQDALENKNLKLVIGMDLTARAFKTECGAWWNHAVAINSKTSQPLTAKEVGL